MLAAAGDVSDYGGVGHLRTRVWLGLAGAALVWFSQPALFVLGRPGGAGGPGRAGAGRAAGGALAHVAVWVPSAAAVVWFSRSEHDARRWRVLSRGSGLTASCRCRRRRFSTLAGFRENYVGVWRVRRRARADARRPELPLVLVFTAVMLFGVWKLWRTRRDLALLLGTADRGCAAPLRRAPYPFTARLFVFLSRACCSPSPPAPAIHCLAPAECREPRAAGRARRRAALCRRDDATAVLAAHLRPLVEHLSQTPRIWRCRLRLLRRGSGLLLLRRATGLRREDQDTGRLLGRTPRGYLRQLDEFRGRERVWIIVSHAQWQEEARSSPSSWTPLDAGSTPWKSRGRPAGPSRPHPVYLYDLSDPDRLGADDRRGLFQSVRGRRMRQQARLRVTECSGRNASTGEVISEVISLRPRSLGVHIRRQISPFEHVLIPVVGLELLEQPQRRPVVATRVGSPLSAKHRRLEVVCFREQHA